MKKCCLIYLLNVFSFIVPAQNKTASRARYPYPWGVVIVTFDKAQTTRAQLDSWMRFLPTLSAYNDLLVSLDLRRCIPNNKRYVNCRSTKEIRLKNVDVNISEIIDLEHSLNPLKYPEGLKGIISYLGEIQTFSLWSARRQRDALARHDVAPLQETYDGLASNKVCDVILERSPLATEKKTFANLVLVDWYNCVWQLEKNKIGSYPHKQWDEFLKLRGIKEKVIEEVPED